VALVRFRVSFDRAVALVRFALASIAPWRSYASRWLRSRRGARAPRVSFDRAVALVRLALASIAPWRLCASARSIVSACAATSFDCQHRSLTICGRHALDRVGVRGGDDGRFPGSQKAAQAQLERAAEVTVAAGITRPAEVTRRSEVVMSGVRTGSSAS